MKRIIILIIFFITSFHLKAENNYCNHEVYLTKVDTISSIANRIWSTVGVVFPKPELKIHNKAIETANVRTLASFDPKTNIIHIGVGFYDFCVGYGESSFALILAHEMGHYFNTHKSFANISGYVISDLEREFIDESLEAEQQTKIVEIELQADLFAAFHCFSAEYEINNQWQELLKKIYAISGVNEKRTLPIDIRLRIIDHVNSKIKELNILNEAAHLFSLIEEYEIAGKCYDYMISENFKSWDMFFNAGNSYALALLKNSHQKDSLIYPFYTFANIQFEKKWVIGLITKEKRSLSKERVDWDDFKENMMSKSLLKYTYLTQMYPELQSAYVSMACLYAITGDISLARSYAIKAEEMAKNDFEKNMAIVAKAIIYNKKDKELALLELDKIKEFPIARYNLNILLGKTDNFEKEYSTSGLENINGVNLLNYNEIIRFNDNEKQLFIEIDSLYISEKNLSESAAREYSNMYGSVFSIETSPDYSGSTSKGVSIGSSINDLIMAYGQPESIKHSGNDMYFCYFNKKIIFRIKNEKVSSWLIYIVE